MNEALLSLSKRRAQAMVAWLCAFVLLAITSVSAAFAANPPPVKQYYVPVPEDQVYRAFKSIYPSRYSCNPSYDVGKPIKTYISISVVADETIIYYDHWEDDFEIDISTPQQPTTQTWGDGNPDNGAPPGIPSDILTPGTIVVLDNNVNPDTRPTVIDFDGGDKIGSTRAVAVTRATWANGSGTLLAGAIEVYDTGRWGLTYTAPVGQDIVPATDQFEFTGMAIMASEDDTTVRIDKDSNGAFETTVTLDEGASALVNGGVLAGAKVSADRPVQTTLITGDICDTYESRWYGLFPDELLDDSYYSPVGTPLNNDGTLVFLHNESSTPLTINWETINGTETPLTAPAGGTVKATIPDNSGAHFYSADGRPMSALAAVDATSAYYLNSRADWGFTLVPERALTAQVLVGWAPGQDPTKPLTENGSPVWVTPVLKDGASGPVKVCVDYNNPVVSQAARQMVNRSTDVNEFAYDTDFTLNELQSQKVFDPDKNQTGMMLYVCDAHAEAGTAVLAVAWGQAPGIASRAVPGLDLGTTVPPASLFVTGKSATIEDDDPDDGIANPGDTITYDVVIINASRIDLPTVLVSDTVPLHTEYVLNTTSWDDGNSVAAIADNVNGTPFPLDEGGVTLPGIPINGVYTVTFQVTVNDPFPLPVDRVHNKATVTIGDEVREPEVETPVESLPSIGIEKATNGQDADNPTGPMITIGDEVRWTYTVSSTGNTPVTNVIVSDDIAGVNPTYVGGDANTNNILDPGELWTYEATGVATEGQYANVGTAIGAAPDGIPVTDTDPSHYWGLVSEIEIVKVANPTQVNPGETVVYSYTVTNEGNSPLADIQVTDDQCSPAEPVLDGAYNVGDLNTDDLLDVTEAWRYTCSMAVFARIINTAVVTGIDVIGETVTDRDQAIVTLIGEDEYICYVPIVTNQPSCPPEGCPVPGLVYPKAIAVHEEYNQLFVTERTNNRLLVVNPDTFELIGSAPTGQQPWGVVLNEGTNRAYVANYGSGDVSIYDATTLALLKTVAVGGEPVLMDILPDQDLVFVVVRDGSKIAIIDGDDVTQIMGSGGSGPYGIAADAVNQRVYVGHRDSRNISMLSESGGVWGVQPGVQYENDVHLFELAFNPNNEKLYSVYTDGSQWSVDAWKPVPGGTWGRYSKTAVGDGGAPDSPKVGGTGLEVNPSTGRVFNVNTADGTVSVLDGNSNSVTKTVNVGDDPFPIAVDSQRNMVYVGLRESGGIVSFADE